MRFCRDYVRTWPKANGRLREVLRLMEGTLCPAFYKLNVLGQSMNVSMISELKCRKTKKISGLDDDDKMNSIYHTRIWDSFQFVKRRVPREQLFPKDVEKESVTISAREARRITGRWKFAQMTNLPLARALLWERNGIYMNRAIRSDLLDRSVLIESTYAFDITGKRKPRNKKEEGRKKRSTWESATNLKFDRRLSLSCIPCRCVRMDVDNRYRSFPPPSWTKSIPLGVTTRSLYRPFRFQTRVSPPTCPRVHTRPILRGVHSAPTRYQDTSTNYPLFSYAAYAKSYGPPSTHVTSASPSTPKSSSRNNER